MHDIKCEVYCLFRWDIFLEEVWVKHYREYPPQSRPLREEEKVYLICQLLISSCIMNHVLIISIM